MNTPESSPNALRVIELGRRGPAGDAAGICGKLLAGFGAEVLRPQPPERPGARETWLHTGKRYVAADPATDRVAFERLTAQADLLLDGLGAGGLEGLGLSVEALRARNPALIIVRTSAFGLTGPYRDYAAEEATLYAASGLMNSTGDGDREPLAAGVPVCADSAGLKAHIAALMAIYRRGREGGGDVVEVSMFETCIDNIEIAMSDHMNLGKHPRRNGDEHARVPWQNYPCRDGEAVIVGSPVRHWLAGARLFEEPALLDPSLHSMADRIARRDEVRDLMAPWLARNSKHDIYHAGQKAKQAWGYVATFDEVLDNPQNIARKSFVEIDQPGYAKCRMPDAPFRGTRLPWTTRPAPDPDAAALPADHWSPRADSADGASVTAPDTQPLAGLVVLDFTIDWAGPHAARLLADYGAEVIRIEYPERVESMRGGYPERVNDHPRIWQLNRNKRSITLDLKNPAHLATCHELVAEADLVIENSRPGVMDRLGLGFAALQSIRPDIIMVSLSAYGATGPESHYAGYGGTMEALGGIQWMTGYAPSQMRRRIREIDSINGAMGACAAMAALTERQATGQGQWIDLSEQEACNWLIGEAMIAYTAGGPHPEPLGNRHPVFAPQGCYPCAGDDRWLSITVRNAQEWAALACECGRPDLADDPELQTAEGRRARHDELDEVIAAWSRELTPEHAEQRLQTHGIPAAFVRTPGDLAGDAHLQARDWLASLADARLPGLAFRFARGGGAVRSRGPDLGADNAAIFTRLQMDRDQWPDLSPENLGTAFDNGPLPPA